MQKNNSEERGVCIVSDSSSADPFLSVILVSSFRSRGSVWTMKQVILIGLLLLW